MMKMILKDILMKILKKPKLNYNKINKTNLNLFNPLEK